MTATEFSAKSFCYNEGYSLVEIGVLMEHADPESGERTPCRAVYDAEDDCVYLERAGFPQRIEPDADFLSQCYTPADLHEGFAAKEERA